MSDRKLVRADEAPTLSQDYITVHELAARLKVSPKWIYNAVKEEENPLPCHDFSPPRPTKGPGRKVLRFKMYEVESWLEMREKKNGSRE